MSTQATIYIEAEQRIEISSSCMAKSPQGLLTVGERLPDVVLQFLHIGLVVLSIGRELGSIQEEALARAARQLAEQVYQVVETSGTPAEKVRGGVCRHRRRGDYITSACTISRKRASWQHRMTDD